MSTMAIIIIQAPKPTSIWEHYCERIRMDRIKAELKRKSKGETK